MEDEKRETDEDAMQLLIHPDNLFVVGVVSFSSFPSVNHEWLVSSLFLCLHLVMTLSHPINSDAAPAEL